MAPGVEPGAMRDIPSWIGTPVGDRVGLDVGTVRDVYHDDATAQPAWLLVGVRERLVLVPAAGALSWSARVIVPVDRELIDTAPALAAPPRHAGRRTAATPRAPLRRAGRPVLGLSPRARRGRAAGGLSQRAITPDSWPGCTGYPGCIWPAPPLSHEQSPASPPTAPARPRRRPPPRLSRAAGSNLRAPLIATGAALAAIAGGIALGAKRRPRHRLPSLPSLPSGLDLSKLGDKKTRKQVASASKQFGAFTRELRKAGEQAERLGNALD